MVVSRVLWQNIEILHQFFFDLLVYQQKTTNTDMAFALCYTMLTLPVEVRDGTKVSMGTVLLTSYFW